MKWVRKMNEIFSGDKNLFRKEVRKFRNDSVKVGEKVKNVNGILLMNEQEINFHSISRAVEWR